ncbi:nuclear transport factor 2 family protein [Salinicola endophyticus]|uniref:Nuclear transport factor 2 family protein n=1 Tax=Salinicola endophyticus TaxID=1949083 RepID=A0AB74U4K9_9GAMM
MSECSRPELIVQRQLDAYNAHDHEAWLNTYAEDAQQFEYPSTLLADGLDAIRKRSISRFQDPVLHASLLQRSVMGNMVIDFEEVRMTFPEGTGRIEMTAIYQVDEGKIKTASFVFGKKTLDTDIT